MNNYKNVNRNSPVPEAVDLSLSKIAGYDSLEEGRAKTTLLTTNYSVTYLLDVVACKGCKMDIIEALREFPISSNKQ